MVSEICKNILKCDYYEVLILVLVEDGLGDEVSTFISVLSLRS